MEAAFEKQRAINLRHTFRIAGPLLKAVEDDQVVIGDGSLELDALAGVFGSHPLEVLDEGLLAVGDVWVVLDVLISDVAVDRLAWTTLVEHQVVERHRCLLVLVLRHHLSMAARMGSAR